MIPRPAAQPNWTALALIVGCLLAASGFVQVASAFQPTDAVPNESEPKQPTNDSDNSDGVIPSGGKVNDGSVEKAGDASGLNRQKDPLAGVPNFGEALVRMVVVLASILIGLLVLAKLLPRWLMRSSALRSKGRITVVDSLQIEPRRRVYLIRVEGRMLLISSSEQGLQTLATGLEGEDDDLSSMTADAPGGEGASDASRSDIEHGHQPTLGAQAFASVLRDKSAVPNRASEGG